MYRAIVVETNDPLQMHRVRFKCPELHDYNTKTEDCPWAVPANDLGTKRCGRWSYPCIGDWVWIQFEKNHPYGPVWTGFADPTRRKFYTLPSISGPTPRPVDAQGTPLDESPDDYDVDYLPADGRPMSHGWQDRYGNLDMHNSVGFFPIEHAASPPRNLDTDNIGGNSNARFVQQENAPVANNPDSKYMLRMTKYGHMVLQSDSGYLWQNEFKGDFEQDETFEINRWKYYQRLIHEDKPSGHDERRLMLLTRYGHKFELRDVGWNISRSGEFGPSVSLSSGAKDQRWIKLRSKGGHLIELCDIGSDPMNDEYVQRSLMDELDGTKIYMRLSDRAILTEDEYNNTPANNREMIVVGDKEEKFESDARFIRMVTRSGIKMAIDDRGSDSTKAQDKNLENDKIGTGVLIKGRATPAGRILDSDGVHTENSYPNKSGDPVGYYWQINEHSDYNCTDWGSPLGQVIEMNDNDEVLTICTGLVDLPSKWEGLEDNEFLLYTANAMEPMANTHHLVLNHRNEFIRLKSRAGHGAAPYATDKTPVDGEFQGLEIHDSAASPWVELVDYQHRGLWFSGQYGIGVLRAKADKDIIIWYDDTNDKIVIRNNTDNGRVQIYCAGNVDIVSDKDVNISAANDVNIQAGGSVRLKASALSGDPGLATLNALSFDTNRDVMGMSILGFFPQINNGDGGPPGWACGNGEDMENVDVESVPDVVEPDDRAT
jgi:hypothetical protein